MEGIASLLPLIFIGAIFYFLLIRPQRNRQRQQQQMQSQLEPGQRIMTTAGLFATVTAIDDDGVELEIAPGVTSRWTRAAISRVLPDESAAADDFDATDSADSAESELAGDAASTTGTDGGGSTAAAPDGTRASAPERDQKFTKDTGTG